MLGWYQNYIISQESYSVAKLRNGELHQSVLVGRVLARTFVRFVASKGGVRIRGPGFEGEGSRANMGENLRCGGCLPGLHVSDMNLTLQEISLLTRQQCALYLSPATMKLLQQVQKIIRQMAAADRHWPKSSGLPIPHVHGMYAQTQICNCDNAHHGSAIQWSRNAALAVMITGSLCGHNLGCMHVD